MKLQTFNCKRKNKKVQRVLASVKFLQSPKLSSWCLVSRTEVAAMMRMAVATRKTKRIQCMLAPCGTCPDSLSSIFLKFSEDQVSTASLQRCFCDLGTTRNDIAMS